MPCPRSSGDPSAIWRYGAALRAFHREGDTWEASDFLRDAIRAGRHVPDHLRGAAERPEALPDAYVPGSEEEAVLCADEVGDVWRTTRGAEQWLKAQRPKRKRRGP